jgi:hypothetical protein
MGPAAHYPSEFHTTYSNMDPICLANGNSDGFNDTHHHFNWNRHFDRNCHSDGYIHRHTYSYSDREAALIGVSSIAV